VLFGILSAVDNPARQAFTQEVVGHDLVRNAVTLNSTTVNVARVIGPAIAAVLVSTVGIGWCFVVNAASFGFVIVSFLQPRHSRACTRSRRCRAGAGSCVRACATRSVCPRSSARC
jgi:MFS family permease